MEGVKTMNSTLPRCRALVRFPNEDGKSYVSGPGMDADQWPARTLDISASGLALVTPRPFEPGSVLSVELPVCNSSRPRRVLACVMRVHALGANEWVLGCQFATELRHQDLQALGARREPTTPPDDRTWVRFPCKIDTRYQSLTDDERDSWPAHVSRLTASGADLVLPRSFEPGSL